ncbi:Hypothetical protein PBC10988_12240 [Planctomycetales bacterium 10988]|nr:Hypothetical protein PBC10988_12240 [Planctomycetales bacterium 10988]
MNAPWLKCRFKVKFIHSRLSNLYLFSTDRLQSSPLFSKALLLYCLTIASLLYTNAFAGPPQFSDSIEFGIAGLYKTGKWTSLRLTIKGGDDHGPLQGRFVVQTEDSDNALYQVESSLYQLSPGQVLTSNPIYLKPGHAGLALDVRFIDARSGRTYANKVYAEKLPIPLHYQSPICVGIGTSFQMIDVVNRLNWEQNTRPEVAVFTETSQLPTRWYGYDAVDWLLLSTERPQLYESMSDAQREALLTWIRMGGKVLFSGGEGSSSILNQPDHPLTQLVPGEFEKLFTLSSGETFERFASVNASEALNISNGSPLLVPQLNDVEGEVLAAEGNDLPLIIHNTYGFGTVRFIAGDLELQTFTNWKGRLAFYSKLLQWENLVESSEDANNNNYQSPQLEWGSELHRNIEQFPGVKLVPFAWVAGLIFLYVLLIGPGDYFLVKKVFKKMELTWITFPIMVIVVSIGAYYLAVYLKGREARLNQVSLVDYDSETGTKRTNSWFTIFSPLTEDYNLSIESKTSTDHSSDDATSRLFSNSDFSLNNQFAANRSGGSLFRSGYRMNLTEARLQQVPLQVWSTKTFQACLQSQEKDIFQGNVYLEKEEPARVSIQSTRKISLKAAVLAYKTSAYFLGDIELASETEFEIDPSRRVSLSSAMTQQFDEVVSQNFDGDPSVKFDARGVTSRSPEASLYRLLQKTLSPSRLSQVDERTQFNIGNVIYQSLNMDNQLQAKKAILSGFSDQPELVLKDQEQGLESRNLKRDHYTYFRFVLTTQNEEE